jgi:hypothetical protein
MGYIRHWGPWALNKGTLALEHIEGRDYWIDLERCTTPAEVLDWIAKVAGKTWADDATVAGLARALNDVLRPQSTLCSFGRPRRLTVTQIRRRVNKVGAR